MNHIIYHVVLPDYWQQFSEKAAYTPPTFEAEGFIHCCTEAQINYVLTTYFIGVAEILLLKIDTNLLEAELKVEPALLFEVTQRDTIQKIYLSLLYRVAICFGFCIYVRLTRLQ